MMPGHIRRWGRPPQLAVPVEAIAAADLADPVMRWMAWLEVERRCSPNTLAAYRRDLWVFLAFLCTYLGRLPSVGDLQRLGLEDLRAYLVERTRRGLLPSSTARSLSALRGFFRYLARHAIVNNPIVKGVQNPRLRQTVTTAPSESEAINAIKSTGDLRGADWISKRDTALLILLHGCGLRLEEALSLTRAEATLAQGGHLIINGKRGKQRIVPVLLPVTCALDDYLAACPFKHYLLFLGSHGQPLHPRIAQHRMAQLGRLIGLPSTAMPHRLRATLAMQLLRAGADLQTRLTRG
jgi:integrase/recombinase XerC